MEWTGRSVRCGVLLPFHAAYPGAAFGDITTAARHAEELGLDSVWVGDHLSTGNALLDGTVALACAAGVTTRVKLGIAVMVPALRQLTWAAKQVASLQYISNNRLQLGVGVGAVGGHPNEWDAAGVTSAGRAARTDQFLDALPRLLAGAPTELDSLPGRPTVKLDPPVGPPEIWIGGTSDAALDRAATYGQGWLSALLSPAQMVRPIARLVQLAATRGVPTPAAGTMIFAHLTEKTMADPAAPVREFLINSYGVEPTQAADILVAGTPAQVAEQLAAYRAVGVTEFVIISFGPDLATQYQLTAQTRSILLD